ncbi:hypothetical protein RSAG8_08583, partial [Rhizoctonia solani AG-8 WAC10335]
MSLPHPRVPIRTTAFDHEGWIRAQQQVACPPPPKHSPPSLLLAHPRWQTDIVTFCSHIARDPHLGRAQITQIQNRKSHRLPSLNEYLLLFFSVDQRRFVARVDYSTRASTGQKEAPLSGVGLSSKQQVTVYHVPLEGDATPWFEDDGMRGSELVAALTTWSSLGASGMGYVSHHLATAQEGTSSQGPGLHDVARLIEAIILESPTHYFKAASSFVTCRSTLEVIHTCFPRDGRVRWEKSTSWCRRPCWKSRRGRVCCGGISRLRRLRSCSTPLPSFAFMSGSDGCWVRPREAMCWTWLPSVCVTRLRPSATLSASSIRYGRVCCGWCCILRWTCRSPSGLFIPGWRRQDDGQDLARYLFKTLVQLARRFVSWLCRGTRALPRHSTWPRRNHLARICPLRRVWGELFPPCPG